MEILTNNGQRLWLIRIGEQGKVSSKIFCVTESGEKVAITFADIKETTHSYSMPPKVEHKLKCDGSRID